MSMQSEIITRLKAVSAVTAIVGNSPARIYPIERDQNSALPAATYRVISELRESVMGRDTGDVRARMQFDCYAETYDGAIALLGALRVALQRWSGGSIQQVFVENVEENSDPDARVKRSRIDFIVWYKE